MPMAKLLSSRAFDPETTSLLGAAFDKAWQTMQTSGSPLADEKHAAATREILAKNILAAGHRGDRDIHQLVEEALALLIISNDTCARHGRKRCGRIRRRASLLRVRASTTPSRIHHLTRELDFAPKTEKDIHKVGASSK
jgi:hypothetical protein